MATIEEQMGTLQQQVQMLVQALQESQARAEAAQVTHLQQMVELQGRVVELTAAQTQARRVTFVDVKGIGKPSSFASDSKQFSAWRFKLGNFLEGIMSGMREGLEWAQDQDTMIESDKLD